MAGEQAATAPESTLAPDVVNEMLRVVTERRALYRNKWPYQWTWFLSLNFYAGNQWISWDPVRREFLLDAQDPDRPRVTENRIQPIVRQAIGRLMKQKLRQICPPDANDEAAVDKAKVRTRLLEHVRRGTDTDAKLKRVATWGALTGNGFARYWFNPDAGPRDKRGNPLGDISVEVISPFSIVVPPNCLTLEECPWIIEATTRSVAWVLEQHGIEVDADASPNAFDQFDARVLDFTSGGAWLANTVGDVDSKSKDGETVSGGTCNYWMYWERPTRAHESGRLIIVAGGKVVYPRTPEDADQGILDHSPLGDLPYNHFRWFDTGFRFWEPGVVELMVPLQRERNKLASMILDGIEHATRASIKAPRGSIKKDDWTADSGSILEYTPVGGLSPEAITTTPVHPEVFQRISMIDQDMADIAGIHFRPPAGVRAAAAFALQQETDTALAEPVADNLEAFLIRDGRLKLQLARKHYNKGRQIRTVGDAMQWEVTEFDAAQLGDDDSVEIQNGGQLAQDKVQRIDQVIKLLGAKDAHGQPVIDAYEARRLLDLENTENIDSQVKADINRARWENRQLDQVKVAPAISVNRWDNHEVHLREHYTRMKRLDFDELSPTVRDAYMQHVTAHEQAKAAAQPPAPGRPPGIPPGQGVPGQNEIPSQAAQMAQQIMPQAPSNQVQAGLQAGLTHVNNVVAQANQ